MSASTPEQPPRRSHRQHRRAESEAGTPEGLTSTAAFIDIPVASTEPTDITPWTGMVPQIAPVPQPRTRREARRLREQGLLPDWPAPAQDTVEAGPAASSTPARRAEAPVTSLDSLAADPEALGSAALEAERAAIAQEATELAELMATSEHSDPTVVDPQIQRRQEALAERAARLNASAAGTSSGPAAVSEPREPDMRHEPVQAAHAHGLDSLAASEAVGRERRMLLIAAGVLALGLIALVVALILTLT
ncbi:hypothetical protein AB0E44_01960 [Micrococcus terreus]|uniref:hypothetical protein n=1 Tax=Micrococcus terreus TaxID=574650 RepID=UPI0034024D88